MNRSEYKSAMEKIKVSTEFKNTLTDKLQSNNVQKKSLKSVYKIVFAVAAIMVIVIGVASANDINSFMFYIGKKQVEIFNKSDSNEVIAIISGEEIQKKDFEVYKLITQQKDKLIAFEQFINDKLLTNLAKESGIKVTEEEVGNGIKSLKETYDKATEEVREQIQSFMKGAGISEEEYWERLRAIIPTKMLRNKYKEKMKEEYKEVNSITDKEFDQEKFDQYLNTLIEKEMSKVVIKNKNYIKK